MSNPIDILKEKIKSDMTERIRDAVDPDNFQYELIDALCHRCAVDETKLKADEALEAERLNRVKW